MTAIEVVLLLIGVVFLLGSFFITEKLSQSEISRVAQLSEDELRIVMNRELESAGARISDMTDKAVDLSMDKIQRILERDCNEKIMAISEYSESAMEQLKKFNKEVTFLYSMLGDKHNELDECMAELDIQMDELRELSAQAKQTDLRIRQMAAQQITAPATAHRAPVHVPVKEAPQMKVQTAPVMPQAEPEQALELAQNVSEQVFADVSDTPAQDGPAEERLSGKEAILERYRAGEDLTDIARELGMGIGEVRLFVELYKGELEA